MRTKAIGTGQTLTMAADFMAAPVSTSTRNDSAEHAGKVSDDLQPRRVDVLIDEFRARGMDGVTAEDLAFHVVLHHPAARTLGVTTLSRDITARGMEPEPAREVATVLLAIELMDRGASYNTVVAHLKRQPISAGEALAGALDASRIHRMAAPDEVQTGTFFAHLAAGLTAVTFAMMLLAVLLNISP